MVDHYAVLQVHPLAEQRVIEKAYKVLVMEYHPDNGGDNERMVAINLAYEVLSDPEKRTHYDRELLGSRYAAGPQAPTVAASPDVSTTPASKDRDDAAQWLGGAGATVRTGFRVADFLLDCAATGVGHVVEVGIAAAQEPNQLWGDSEGWDKAYAQIGRLTRKWPQPISNGARCEAASLQVRRVKAISFLDFPRGAEGQTEVAWMAVRHPDPQVRARVKERYESKHNEPMVGFCDKCRHTVDLDSESRCPAGHELLAIRYAGTRQLVEEYARQSTS